MDRVRKFELTETKEDSVISLLQSIIGTLSECIDTQFKKISGNYQEKLFCEPDTETYDESQLIQTSKDLGCLLLNTLCNKDIDLIQFIFDYNPGYVSKSDVDQIINLLYGDYTDNLYEYISICKKNWRLSKIIRNRLEEIEKTSETTKKLIKTKNSLKSITEALENQLKYRNTQKTSLIWGLNYFYEQKQELDRKL